MDFEDIKTKYYPMLIIDKQPISWELRERTRSDEKIAYHAYRAVFGALNILMFERQLEDTVGQAAEEGADLSVFYNILAENGAEKNLYSRIVDTNLLKGLEKNKLTGGTDQLRELAGWLDDMFEHFYRRYPTLPSPYDLWQDALKDGYYEQ